MAQEIDLKTNPEAADFSIPGEIDLPPAGFQRDEELARRTDTLTHQAEQQATEREQYAIPPDHDALRPDRNREIQYHIQQDHLHLPAHPLYMFKWVYCTRDNSTMVWAAKSTRGGRWKIATPDELPKDFDVMGMLYVDNSIRIGDTILMYLRKDEYFKWDEEQKRNRLRQQYGIEAEIHDLAARVNRKEGREVFRNVETPSITGTMSERNERFIKARAAQRTAASALGNRMKEGPLPGVPIR